MLLSLLAMSCVKLHGAEARIHSNGAPPNRPAARCSLPLCRRLQLVCAATRIPQPTTSSLLLGSIMSRLHTLVIGTMLLLAMSNLALASRSPSPHRHRQRDEARREAAAAAAAAVAAAPATPASSPSARLEVPPFTGSIDPRILKTPIHAADVPLHATAAVESKEKSSSKGGDSTAQPCSHADKTRDEAHTVDISSDKQSIKQRAKSVLKALMQRIKDIRARIEHRETKGERGAKGTPVS